jgi:hypothetical protein
MVEVCVALLRRSQRKSMLGLPGSSWGSAGGSTCALGQAEMIFSVHSLYTRIIEVRRATPLMRFLSQRHRRPSPSGEAGDHASDGLISTRPHLLRRQRGEGMSDLHSLVIRAAKSFGMVTGRIHEGLSAQENRWDATIFKGQDVVHTARHARASVADGSHHEVAPLGHLLHDGWRRDTRIDEFGLMHGLCHAIFGAQSRGHVL